MRHLKQGRKLKRVKQVREALFKSLAANLILQEKIKTTAPKAKELVKLMDRLINLAKKDKKQGLGKYGFRPNILAKLTEEIKKWYPDRSTGYTKIVPLYYRKGDHAKIVQVSLLPHKVEEKKEKSKPSKKK